MAKTGLNYGIYKTLTHRIYVNTSNVVPMAVGEFAFKSLKQ